MTGAGNVRDIPPDKKHMNRGDRGKREPPRIRELKMIEKDVLFRWSGATENRACELPEGKSRF